MVKRLIRWLAVLGIIGGGVELWRRQSEGEIVSSVDSLGRNATVAGMGARTGGRWAATQARKTFASAERRDELDAEFEMKTTEDVVASLGNLKGLSLIHI